VTHFRYAEILNNHAITNFLLKVTILQALPDIFLTLHGTPSHVAESRIYCYPIVGATSKHKCQCVFYKNVHDDLISSKILKTSDTRPATIY